MLWRHFVSRCFCWCSWVLHAWFLIILTSWQMQDKVLTFWRRKRYFSVRTSMLIHVRQILFSFRDCLDAHIFLWVFFLSFSHIISRPWLHLPHMSAFLVLPPKVWPSCQVIQEVSLDVQQEGLSPGPRVLALFVYHVMSCLGQHSSRSKAAQWKITESTFSWGQSWPWGCQSVTCGVSFNRGPVTPTFVHFSVRERKKIP